MLAEDHVFNHAFLLITYFYEVCYQIYTLTFQNLLKLVGMCTWLLWTLGGGLQDIFLDKI